MTLESFSLQTPRLKLAGLKSTAGGGEPVVALHGWLDNAASFIPLYQNLADRKLERAFWSLELPGHGLSEHRPSSTSYHLSENIIDVLAFCQTLLSQTEMNPDGSKKVTLVGHSLGGIIASLVAASAPEKISKLVLLDSLGPFTDEENNVLPQLRRAISRATLFKKSNLTVYPTVDRATKVRMSGVGNISEAAAQLLVERGIEKRDDGFVWTSDPRLMDPSLVRFSEAQVRAIYEGIECPVCLICGEDGYFGEYSRLRHRLEYIKDLTMHTVRGGHHFHMEGDVSKTAEIIHEFVG